MLQMRYLRVILFPAKEGEKMTQNERIRNLRKALNLTQVEFSKRIRLSQSHLTSVETGKRKLTDPVSKLICSEFNVNEQWLRTGEGEMFEKTVSGTIDQLVKEFNLDELDKKILSVYAQLPAQHRAALKEYLVRLSLELAPADEPVEQLSIDDESVESVENQYLESRMSDADYKKSTSDGASKTG